MTSIVPSRWPSADVPELGPGAAHVWSIALDGDSHSRARDELSQIIAAYPDPRVLCSSISHSRTLAVIAVAHGRAVGVDVEAVRDVRGLQRIADTRFTEAEAAELGRLDGAERRALFLRLWTRKEAYLKATGEGIAGGLASFDALALEPHEGWEFSDLDAGPGYAGALAVAPPGFSPATARAGAVRRSR